MNRALAAGALALALGPARADVLKGEADLRPFADRVMAAVTTKGLGAGVDAMRPYVAMPEGDLQGALIKLQTQREQVTTRYGRTTGYEFVGQRKLGTSLVRLTYVERLERHAMPWMFHFYRTPNGWILDSFISNDLASELFNIGP